MPGAQDRWGYLAEPSAGRPQTSAPDLPQGADRPERGSLVDLRQRLEQLPPGHPSSPYNDDLTPKPPVAQLKALELPLHANEPTASEHSPSQHSTSQHSSGGPGVGALSPNGAARPSGHEPAADGWASTAGQVSEGEAPGRNGVSGGLARPADVPYDITGAPGSLADDVDDPGDLGTGPDGLADEPVSLADEPVSLTDEPDGLTDEPVSLTDGPGRSADEFDGLADRHDGATDGLDGTTSGWRSVTGSLGGLADELGGDTSGQTVGSPDPLTASSWPGSSARPAQFDRLTASDRLAATGRQAPPDHWATSDPPAASERLATPDRLATRGGSINTPGDAAVRGRAASRADTMDWGSTPSWGGTSGWDSGPDHDDGPHDNGAGAGWADPEPAVDTLTHAVINVEPEPEPEEPLSGPDGSWEWNGRYLTPAECQIAEQALGRCRIAEGRNVFGGYGHSGLTPAMRRIEAQIRHGQLLPDTEATALKSLDSFKEKLADLVLRHPDKSAEDLALEVYDGIRYTFIVEPEHYAQVTLHAHSRLKGNGFELEVRRNCWPNPEYKGINSRWRDPAHDLVFEVQFHTPSSWDLRQRAHALYEAITDPATSPGERERLRAVYAEMSDGVSIPPGCAAIPDYRKEGQ
jgi:hypothetical protein